MCERSRLAVSSTLCSCSRKPTVSDHLSPSSNECPLARCQAPRALLLGDSSFGLPPGGAVGSAACELGDGCHFSRPFLPCVPRLVGVGDRERDDRSEQRTDLESQ